MPSKAVQKLSQQKALLGQKALKARLCIGKTALRHGTVAAQDIFTVRRQVVDYWTRKVVDPGFHPSSHGGFRFYKFDNVDRELICAILWQSVKQKPTIRLMEHVKLLREGFGLPVSKSYVQRVFQSWNWTWKRVSRFQLSKYTEKNIYRYMHYLLWLHSVPLQKVKFMDEGHFVSRQLHRQRALSRQGEPVTVVQNVDLDHSLTLTVLVSILDPDPVKIDMREDSNSAQDFLAFLESMIQQQFLCEGDWLVMDNASIHTKEVDTMERMEKEHKIRFIFLPTYSPELNPCELVFAFVKKHLREFRGNLPLEWEIIRAVSLINLSDMKAFYAHCLEAPFTHL